MSEIPAEIQTRLDALFKPEYARRWWEHPNPYLESKRPDECEPHRVIALLDAIADGVFM